MQKQEQQNVLGQFPHRQPILRELKIVDSQTHHKIENQKQSFQSRFPWLTFANHQDKQRIFYQGKHTEISHPFLLRFDIKKQRPIKNIEIDSVLSQFTHAWNDKSLKNDLETRWKKGEFKQMLTLEPESGISQGYLLTGIAKPSTTVHIIFETLFSDCFLFPNITNDDKSDMSNEVQLPLGYKIMHQNWQYRLHSYEYLKFMTRIYCQLKSNKLNHADICNQLFYNIKGESLTYSNKQNSGQLFTISDQQYFNYFSKLFQLGAHKIQQTLINSQNNEQIKKQKSIDIDLRSCKGPILKLTKINYQQYVKSMYKGCELSENSLNKAIIFHQKRHKNIIEDFHISTRKQRLKILNDLKTSLTPSIQVIPIKESCYTSNDEDNYLILMTHQNNLSHTNPSQRISLNQLVFQQNQYSIQKTSEITLKQNMRRKIFNQLFKHTLTLGKRDSSLIHPLLRKIDLNPKHLIFDAYKNTCDIDYDYALSKFLKLNRLPLTNQQSMINMTPDENIDFFQILNSIMADFYPQEFQDNFKNISKTQYYGNLCQILSDDNLKFIFKIQKFEKITKISQKIDKQGYQRLSLQYKKLKRFTTDTSLQRQTNQINNLSFIDNFKNDIYHPFIEESNKYVTNIELFHLLLLALIQYENIRKQKFLIHQYQSNEKKLVLRYKKGDPCQHKKACQFGLIVLIIAKVIQFVQITQLKSTESAFNKNDGTRIIRLLENYYIMQLKKYLKYCSIDGIYGQDQFISFGSLESLINFDNFYTLYCKICSRSQSLSIYQNFKQIMKTSLIIHLYRSWLMILLAVFKIEHLDRSKIQNFKQEAYSTIKSIYSKIQIKVEMVQVMKTQICRDSRLQNKQIQKIIQQAEKNRKVYKFLKSGITEQQFKKMIQVAQLRSSKNKQCKQKVIDFAKNYILIDLIDSGYQDIDLLKILEKREKIMLSYQIYLFCYIYQMRENHYKLIILNDQSQQISQQKMLLIDILKFFLIGSVSNQYFDFFNDIKNSLERDYCLEKLSQLMISVIAKQIFETDADL